MSDASELIAQQIAAAGITPGELTPVGSVTKTYVDTQDATLQGGINSVASLAASAQQTADTAISRAKMDFGGVNDITASTYGDRFYIVQGVGITVSTNPTTKEVTITATGQAAPAAHASTHIPGGSDPIQTATTTRYGLIQLNDTTTSTSKTLAPTADVARRLQVNVDSKMSADRPSNLVPNSTGSLSWSGWRQIVGTWFADKSNDSAPAAFAYTAAVAAGVNAYIESDTFAAFPGQVYNVSVEFYSVGFASGSLFLQVVSSTGTVLASLPCGASDGWVRRNLDFTVPAGVSAIVVRLVVEQSVAAGYKGFRRIQITIGSGVQPWNPDSDFYLVGQMVMRGYGSPEGAVTRPVGSLYLRSDGGTSTTLYVKQSGAGNTGWVAK